MASLTGVEESKFC